MFFRGIRFTGGAGLLACAALAVAPAMSTAAPLVNLNLGVAQVTIPAQGGGTGGPLRPTPTPTHSASCSAVFAGSMTIQTSDLTTFKHFSGVVATGTVSGTATTGSNPYPTFWQTDIQWGDGTTTPGTYARSGNTFTLSGTHDYAAGGAKSAAVQFAGSISPIDVLTQGSLPSSFLGSIYCGSTFTMNVLAGVIGQPVSFFAQSGSEFNGAVATFTDDAPSDASKYSATIIWGDGTSSVGVVAPAGGDAQRAAFEVDGTHTYFGSPSSVPVGVTVIDNGHGSTFIHSTANIISSGG